MTTRAAPAILDGNAIAAELEGHLAALDEVDARRIALSAEIETLLAMVETRHVDVLAPEGRSLLTVLARADKLTQQVARDKTCTALCISRNDYWRYLQTFAPPHPKAELRPTPEPETKPEPEAKQSAEIDEAQGGRCILQGGRICAVSYDRQGARVVTPLCNFTAQIAQEVSRDNGQETTRVFGVEGRLDTGQSLPRVQVDSAQFAGMRWVTSSWGVRAIVRAGQATTDRLREAIQLLSQDAETRHVYVHTGWREIGGQRVYLTAGGALGLDGVDVDLEDRLQVYRLPPNPTQAGAGMKASLRFLDVAPASITFPVWAAMFLAPLTPLMAPDFLPWLYGPTGSLKSTLLALAMCHYGAFDRRTLPGSWASTENQLEKLAFLVADAPLPIDDFAPAATHYDAQELERKAARIVRAVANRSGRGRLRSDLSLRVTYVPRGAVLSTGEQMPCGQSVEARVVGIEMRQGDVDLKALTCAQGEGELYPQAMAGYILWLREQWPHLAATLPTTWLDLRSKVVDAVHLRVPEWFSTLYLALDVALAYAVDVRAIASAEADERRARGKMALEELARAQSARVQGERPTVRFLSVLRELLAQNKVYLKPCESEHMTGECLGWQDEDFLYLLSAASYNKVSKFCRDEGGYFPLKASTLHKMLAEEGCIEVAQDGFLAQVWRDNRNQRVLKLRRGLANL
jgi:hypothetical protein